MTRPGSVRAMTEAEASASRAVAEAKAAKDRRAKRLF
jgi:hypothetical protein